MIVSQLKPGDRHFMAYVGPPTQYDFMGATQFRLLCTLGLRSNHRLLDFGCGSLRAGRLLIPYLDEARYYGVEPEKWLIEDAVRLQLGADLVRIKKPRFHHNDDFLLDFGVRFDFVLAQSIFSHAGPELVQTALRAFYDSLAEDGIIACTFVEGDRDFDGHGWVYPDCVTYRASTIRSLADDAGLSVARIPWYHPRQTWYLLAKEKQRLPNRHLYHLLAGAVLSDAEFAASCTQADGNDRAA